MACKVTPKEQVTQQPQQQCKLTTERDSGAFLHLLIRTRTDDHQCKSVGGFTCVPAGRAQFAIQKYYGSTEWFHS